MPRSATSAQTAAQLGCALFIALLACGLGGTTLPFTASKLLELYPTHDDYVAKFTAAADEALAKGYLLQADYDEVIEQAQDAPIPN